MLDRQTLFIIVVALSMVNGIFSPLLKIAVPVSAVLLPELFPRTVQWVLLWASVLLSTLTLLLSGIPAALYERFVERDSAATTSLWIWLAGAIVLSLPAALRTL
jgi:heme/copper-type cytochrome/quinol oxidase subunit 3